MPPISCFHCGLPVTDSNHYEVTIAGESRPMCCPGCQSVAQTILDMGMESYYEQRQNVEPGAIPSADLVPEFLDGLTDWDDPNLQNKYVHTLPDQHQEITLLIDGITCAACVWLLEKQLNQQPGVNQCNVNLSNHHAQVIWNPDKTSLSGLIKSIAKVGYKAEPYSPLQQEAQIKRENKQALTRIGLAGLGAMQVMMYAAGLYLGAFEGMDAAHQQFLRSISALICTPVYFYSGLPFLAGAFRSLKNRHLSMDVPVALAISFAYFASLWATAFNGPEVYFDSVCMFVFFLSVGRYLEMRARHRSQQTSIRLSHQQIQTARLLDSNDAPKLIPAETLQPGDCVLVKAGEIIPADGEVIKGASAANESMLTGESLPLEKTPGDSVTGGTVNVDQPLTITITSRPQDGTLSTLRRLLERAEADKPKTFILADKVASYFVAVVLVVSVAVYGYWGLKSPQDAFWIMLSVLVVTCPCALSLATPAAVTAATASLTQIGFLSTRAHTIEAIDKVTDVVFDKTGTLTLGKFTLTQITPLQEIDESILLSMAAGLERESEHPIAKAFHQQHIEHKFENVTITANQGVEGLLQNTRYRIGKSSYANFNRTPIPQQPQTNGQWLLLASEHGPLAWFRVEDLLRESAHDVVQFLEHNKLNCHILSGDASSHVNEVAKQLEIQHVYGNATPDDKLSYIKRLQADGRRVLMVGDGINDAPVLAGADVSVSLAEGSDLAKLAADGLMLGTSLNPLTKVFNTVAKTHRIIRQNLSWAIVYNITALPLAAAGFIPPWASALGMSLSSLLVVLNALRLNKPLER